MHGVYKIDRILSVPPAPSSDPIYPHSILGNVQNTDDIARLAYRKHIIYVAVSSSSSNR